MPTVSVFIRKEDLPAWKALENKSQWLHEKLNPFGSMVEKVGSMAKTECKNGHPIPEGRTKCLGKGCKYS